tara:strand:- start:547 stop:735 length:189 start_codon:yes stop_codon:yes gene_type:complete
MISAKSGEHVIVTNDLLVIRRLFFEQDYPAMRIEVSMFVTLIRRLCELQDKRGSRQDESVRK